jgi:uncharacterized BrkB/YihY/UPF0761 family membrane protein
VVVLIWVYYSAQIVLLGAEFTHSQARREERPNAKGIGSADRPPEQKAAAPSDRRRAAFATTRSA